MPRLQIAAAASLAAKLGLRPVSPEVIKIGKHTSLRLNPLPIVARIAVGADAGVNQRNAEREVIIAAHLALHGAPAVRLAPHVSPGPHLANGYTITLWEYVAARSVRNDAEAIAAVHALKQIHCALDALDVELPDFRQAIDSCEVILSDSSAAPGLDARDRSFLLRLYEDLRQELESQHPTHRPLHGDTHLGKVMITDTGAIWLDLEAACDGPLEWDVVALPQRYWSEFDGLDPMLTSLMSKLRSLCVATWCWAAHGSRSEVDEAAIYHLGNLKSQVE